MAVTATTETLTAAIEALRPQAKVTKKYAVLEQGFNRERVVFTGDDRAAAQRIADQHPARRVVLNR